MKQRYNFSLLFALLVVCAHQLVSSSDSHPNKRQRLTHLLSNASSSKPRYHTRLVTEYRAQQAEKLTDQLDFYKKLKKKRDASATHHNLIQRFNYLDLPVELQREVSDFYGVDRCFKSVRLLLENGNRLVEKRDFSYHSPLQKAIYDHDYDRVQILLALHANINGTQHDCKRTPLYMSVEAHAFSDNKTSQIKSYAIFKYLLEKGADYNKSSPDTIYEYDFDVVRIPIWVAISYSTTTTLLEEFLNLPNINLHIKNEDGHTVFDCAKLHAMSPSRQPEIRKHCYKACQLLENNSAPSSIMLKPMPTDKELLRQWIEE